MQPQPLVEAQKAVPAASPSRAVPILQAHSTPAWPGVPAKLAAAAELADEAPAHRQVPAKARPLEHATPRSPIHPDRGARAGAVDLMGVPGRFCLWIQKYLRCVVSVFSSAFNTFSVIPG